MAPTIRHPRLLLSLSAVLTGLCVTFPKVFGLWEWVAMVPALAVLMTEAMQPIPPGAGRLRQRTRLLWQRGLTFYFLYFFVAYHWFITMYPMTFTGLGRAESVLVIAVAWLGLSLLQALLASPALLLFSWLTRQPLLRRHPVLTVPTLASLFVLVDWSQTLGWWGVPWARLALGQTECLPMLQSVSLLGSYGLTLLIVAVNALLAYAVTHRSPPCRPRRCALLALLLLGSNLLFGTLRLCLHEPQGESITVAALQGDFPSKTDWAIQPQEAMDVYAQLTREAAAQGATVILWPESAIPASFSVDNALGHDVAALARECGVTLVIGALHGDEASNHNNLYVVDPDGTYADTVYTKRRPVPFGEYLPMANFFRTVCPPLAEISMIERDVLPGTSAAPLPVDGVAVGGLICFDSIYESLALQNVREGAQLLFLATNDSWFGTSAANHMHTAHARLRAVENGRYLLRAGNTGLTAILSDTGELTASVPLEERTLLIGTVYPSDELTVYTRCGDLPVWAAGAWLLLLSGVAAHRHHRKGVQDENTEKPLSETD